jgi:hypothetical protein
MLKRTSFRHLAGATILISSLALSALVVMPAAFGDAQAQKSPAQRASPIYGVTIPEGYRQWELVAPSHEADPLNELRAILGNATALAAYRRGSVPFPDGTILAKLAWKHIPSPEIDHAFVPGAATTVQIMVKDSKRYPDTGGWGFGRFVNGVPVDEAQHETCFACHSAFVKDHDFVFTRLAP